MTELALTLPLLLFMVVGAMEYGRVVFATIVVTNAAREGAYCMAYDPTTCDLKNAVENETSTAGLTNVTESKSGSCTVLNDCTVKVTACVPNFFLLKFYKANTAPICKGNDYQISKSVTMQVVEK